MSNCHCAVKLIINNFSTYNKKKIDISYTKSCKVKNCPGVELCCKN